MNDIILMGILRKQNQVMKETLEKIMRGQFALRFPVSDVMDMSGAALREVERIATDEGEIPEAWAKKQR